MIVEVLSICGTVLALGTYAFVAKINGQSLLADEIDDEKVQETLALLREVRDQCAKEATMARVKFDTSLAHNMQLGAKRAQAEIDRILKTGKL